MSRTPPNLRAWLTRPFKCLRWHLKRTYRNFNKFWYQLTHRGARRKAWKKIVIFIKKNARIGAVILASYGAYVERQDAKQSKVNEWQANEIADVLSGKISSLNVNMDNSFLPWAEVTKKLDRYRVTGTNYAYDRMFNIIEVDLLGHDMTKWDSIGRIYRRNDSLAIDILLGKTPDSLLIVPEPNYADLDKELFVVKKGFIGRDTIVRMFIFYKQDWIRAIDNLPDYEVIKIVSDTLPNAVGDTIKKN